MPQTVEVRFKGTRRAFYTWPDDQSPLRLQEPVIVRVERGEDLGRISATGDTAAKKCGGSCSCPATPGDHEEGGKDGEGASAPDAVNPSSPPSPPTPSEHPPVLRRASQDDVKRHNELRRAEDEDRRRAAAKVREHKLEMKVSDLEWQWDRHRLTVYFTAEQRVDVRALVRDLASAFKTRIDLRQIGVRDEAARLSGVGRCGREYCCSTWLTELSPVNLALAKDQHLSLNPAQISGGCGRLLCCLTYEHEFYVASRKRFPKEGKALQTRRGSERVVAVDIFRERVLLRGADETRTIGLEELREEMDAAALTGPEAIPEVRPAPAPRRERPAARQELPPAQRVPSSPPSPPSPPSSSAAGDDVKRRKRRRRRRRPGGQGGPDGPGGQET